MEIGGAEMVDEAVGEGTVRGLQEMMSRSGLSRREVLRLFGGTSLAVALGGASGVPGALARTMRSSAGGGTGTAVLGYGFEWTHIDPAQASLAGESTIVDNMYDSLFDYAGFPPKLVPRLVQSYSVSKDGRTYDFQISPKATFHDGSKLTASDVVYSMTRVLEIKGAPYSIWQGILTPDMLSAPTRTTFRVKMPRAYAALPTTLAWLYVVNQKLVSAHVSKNDYGAAWVDQNDAGSGPFTLTQYQQGTQLNFDHYAQYWRGWKGPYLDGWVYSVIREPATIGLGLQSGSVSITDLFSLTIDNLVAAKQGGAVVLDSHPGLSVVSIKQNNQKYPTNNKAFRKAVAYAFNYDAVVNGLLRGQTNRQYGAYPKGFEFFKDFQGTPLAYNTNLDMARHYLAESGVNVKTLGPLGYLFRGDDDTQKNYGLILKSSLANLGINVELQGVSIAQLLANLTSPKVTPNFTRISNSSLITDPDPYCRQYLSSTAWYPNHGQWYTASYYKNPTVDRLIAKAEFEPNQAKRAQMYTTIQDTVYDDAPDVWVDQSNWLVDRRANLKGFVYSGLGAFPIPFWPMYFNPPQPH
jgi:peptide/nickel transport system substrate-binding protein